MLSSKPKIFTDISYFALNQMETNANHEEPDDERIAGEVKDTSENEADDEFSTYFTDQKVVIPEDDKVMINCPIDDVSSRNIQGRN